MTDRVHIVMLRQPGSYVGEARTDPFYEFGCFGLTGCHSTNIMGDKKAAGGRIAFAQGGRGEVRLVLLTPPTEFEAVGELNVARLRSPCPLGGRARRGLRTPSGYCPFGEQDLDISHCLVAVEHVTDHPVADDRRFRNYKLRGLRPRWLRWEVEGMAALP
ncbi:MAG: hypothetical protein WCC48_13395 [Anaeromyxobacteraceae bacterium]